MIFVTSGTKLFGSYTKKNSKTSVRIMTPFGFVPSVYKIILLLVWEKKPLFTEIK